MKRLTMISALLLGVATQVQAATITHSYGLPLVEATTEINQSGLLNKFDPTLGLLTGATLTIFGSATTNISLNNTGSTTQNARATSFVELSWASAVAGINSLLTDVIGMTFTTGGSLSYAPGQSRSFGPLVDSGDFSYNLSSILASLSNVGGGTFDLSCESVSGITVIGGGGNVASSQTTTAGCGASIEYTYTPTTLPPSSVPEPGSLALLGLAMTGLGLARRRITK